MEYNRNEPQSPKTRLAVVWENLDTGEMENVSPVLRRYLTSSTPRESVESQPNDAVAGTPTEPDNEEVLNTPRVLENRPDVVDDDLVTGVIEPVPERRRPYFYELDGDDDDTSTHWERYVLGVIFALYVIGTAFMWMYFHEIPRTE